MDSPVTGLNLCLITSRSHLHKGISVRCVCGPIAGHGPALCFIERRSVLDTMVRFNVGRCVSGPLLRFTLGCSVQPCSSIHQVALYVRSEAMCPVFGILAQAEY